MKNNEIPEHKELVFDSFPDCCGVCCYYAWQYESTHCEHPDHVRDLNESGKIKDEPILWNPFTSWNDWCPKFNRRKNEIERDNVIIDPEIMKIMVK